MKRLLPLLLLSGCSTTGPRPVEVQIQRQTVEVQRPCAVTAPERPATVRASDLPTDARDALRVAVAALLRWQGDGGYADRAEAAIGICARR